MRPTPFARPPRRGLLFAALTGMFAAALLAPRGFADAPRSGQGSAIAGSQADNKEKDKKGADKKDARRPGARRGGAAEGAGDSEGDFKVVGTLGEKLKDSDYWELTYQVQEEKKRVKKTALVKLGEELPLLSDRIGRFEELKEGAVVQIFGKPEEREIPGNAGGIAGYDRQIKRGQLVVGGEKMRISKAYKDAKDAELQWCEATVEKSGKGGITVQFNRTSYRVIMDKQYQVILREAVDEAQKSKLWPKLVKKGALVSIRGRPASEPPAGVDEKLKDAPAIEAVSLVLVDKRVSAYYGQQLEH